MLKKAHFFLFAKPKGSPLDDKVPCVHNTIHAISVIPMSGISSVYFVCKR